MMKSYFTLLFAALSVAAFSQSALAKDTYVGVYGGLNFDNVIDVPFVDSQTGYVEGVVLGTSVESLPGLRLEADLSFRQNQVDVAFGPGVKVDHNTTALMGNVVYDVPVNMGPVRPYVLVGAGYAETSGTVEDVPLLKVESTGFAWQLGAGVTTTLAPGVDASLGYRYFDAPDLAVLGTDLSDGTNHSVVVGVNFKL